MKIRESHIDPPLRVSPVQSGELSSHELLSHVHLSVDTFLDEVFKEKEIAGTVAPRLPEVQKWRKKVRRYFLCIPYLA